MVLKKGWTGLLENHAACKQKTLICMLPGHATSFSSSSHAQTINLNGQVDA
jgi:hypothetical protein